MSKRLIKAKTHLILFDSSCSLCTKSVGHIISIDVDQIFLFAPLDGKTAGRFIDKTHLSLNSLILIENYNTSPQISIRTKALFKIFFYLGGIYKALGVLAYIPPIFDPLYRILAKHRHKFGPSKSIKTDPDRFLP